MPANYLFYNTFQVFSKLVHANCVHTGTLMYGNAVQLYTISPNKAKHRDGFFVPPGLHEKAARVGRVGRQEEEH
jgi:hypothetical protein